MYEAYCRIFDRCGIPYAVVEAESGPIGGDSSHEFMVPSSTGEDTIIQCPACGYAANKERAEVGVGSSAPIERDPAAPASVAVETPNRRTIEEVCDFLKIEKSNSAKLLVFLADEKPVAALIRGDHEANEACCVGWALEGKVRRRRGVCARLCSASRFERSGTTSNILMTPSGNRPSLPITNETVLEYYEWLFAPWVKELGLREFAVSPGQVIAILPQSKRLQFVSGAVCGQVIMSAVDTIASLAMSTTDRPLRGTVYQHTHFLRPAMSEDLKVQANVLRFGKTSAFAETKVTFLNSGGLVAHSTLEFAF